MRHLRFYEQLVLMWTSFEWTSTSNKFFSGLMNKKQVSPKSIIMGCKVMKMHEKGLFSTIQVQGYNFGPDKVKIKPVWRHSAKLIFLGFWPSKFWSEKCLKTKNFFRIPIKFNQNVWTTCLGMNNLFYSNEKKQKSFFFFLAHPYLGIGFG